MRRRLGVLTGGVAGVALFAWLAGFIWFVLDSGQPGTQRPAADGIVVLTGGADRIVTGVKLLQQGSGRVLLISGVGHGAEFATLLRGTAIDPAPLLSRVTIGRSATSTAGNADETAGWVRAQGLHSLLVVTAGYHMRRALTELRRSLPGIALLAVPVMPRGGSQPALGRLAAEYTKWLAAELWLGRLEAGGVSIGAAASQV